MKNKAAVELGRRGGKARAKKLTPEQRTRSARKAARSRWKSKNQLFIKRIEPIAFDPDAPRGPQIEYVTKEQLRKLYPSSRNPQKKAPVAVKGTRQTAERV